MSDLLDLVTDDETRPEGLVEGHRFDWPFNTTTIKMNPDKGSVRNRLKAALAELEEQGLSTEGPLKCGRSQSKYAPDVVVWADFDAKGDAYRGMKFALDSELVTTVQPVLLSHGLPAIVTLDGELIVAQKIPDDEHELLSFEINCGRILTGDDLSSARRWAEEGCSIREISSRLVYSWTYNSLKEWLDRGINASDGYAWKRNGSTPAAASDWVEQGISYFQARDWQREGISPAKAGEILAGGGPIRPRLAAALLRKKHKPAEIRAWADLLGWDFAETEMSAWVARGVTGSRLSGLVEAGYDGTTLPRLAKWLDGKSRPESELWEWALLGPDVLRSGEVKAWENLGADPEQVKDWQKAFNRRDLRAVEVKRLTTFGVTPAELAEWAEQHPALGQNQRWMAWRDAGIKPEQAAAWVQIDETFSNYRKAEPWISGGWTAEQAKGWHEKDITSYQQAREWIDLHPRFADPKVVADLLAEGFHPSGVSKLLAIIAD